MAHEPQVLGGRLIDRFPYAGIDPVTQLTSVAARLLAEYRDAGGDLTRVQLTFERPHYLLDGDERLAIELRGYAA